MAVDMKRAEAIFNEALDRSVPEDRAAFLERACGKEPELRERVERLLVAHGAADSFMALPDPERTIDAPTTIREGPGSMIGRYKLLQQIGEGGFGVVFMAEQKEPVHRKVALKIIKLGMDTRQVVARFEAERQALAMMDHPNIAKVLDAGATDTGRPYFVMELVKGVPITTYCNEAKLTTRERLDLFVCVCAAVQHAHQKGIIHRDLKPSNVLVTMHDDKPVPKVIDFGVAKATQNRLTEKTLFTEYRQMIGTPAYMSPEQAQMSGLDVDTRSDIYSLGVLLYELLTGSTPFDGKELMSQAFAEMQRIIREVEPPVPSTRLNTLPQGTLATVAGQRRCDPNALSRSLRGDLDWIVMKCLEKDRTRRYETANGLAKDVGRFLSDEPVEASPPSATYRIQKAIRRNRLAFGAAAAVVLALGLGVVGSTWQAVRATRAEKGQARLAESEGKERAVAQVSEKGALLAKAEAEAAKGRAEGLAYVADMNLAQRALLENNMAGARQLLEMHRPTGGKEAPWEWRYLWQQSRGDAPRKLLQADEVLGFLLNSSDDRWLVVGGVKSGLTIWDISNRSAIKKVRAIKDSKAGVPFALQPHGELFACGAMVVESKPPQYQIVLGNVEGRGEDQAISMGEEAPLGIEFTEDGKRLVVLTQHLGQKLQVVSIPEGKVLRIWTSDPMPAAQISMESVVMLDHSRLAVFGGKELRAIDLETMKERWNTASEKVLDGQVFGRAAVVAKDDKTLLDAQMFDGAPLKLVMRARDVTTGTLLNTQSMPMTKMFFDLEMLPDGKTFVTAMDDQTLQMWDMSSLEHIVPVGEPFKGHSGAVGCCTILHDGKTMLSGGADGNIYEWDLTAARDHLPYQVVKGMKKMIWGTAKKGWSMMDDQGRFYYGLGIKFKDRKLAVDTGAKPDDCTWADDGERERLVTMSGGKFKLWDIPTGKLIKEFGNLTPSMKIMSMSTDGKHMIVTDDAEKVYREWDLTTFQEERSWPIEGMWQWRNGVSPDHRLFVSSTYDGEFTMWDMVKDTRIKKQLDMKTVLNITFSRDGKYFAASSYLGYACVFETETMKQIAKVGDLRTAIYYLDFSPDSKLLVTSENAMGKLQVWDIQSQRELLTLAHPMAMITPVFFTADGRYITLAVGDDQYFWEAPSWEEIQAAERAKQP